MTPSKGILPASNLVEHKITLQPGSTPIAKPPYRCSPHIKGQISLQVDDLLKQGVIEETVSSPWSSPIILVKKPDGKYRFVVDFRGLNALTVPTYLRTAHLEDSINSLGANSPKYFTKLDMYSGFHQIPLHEDSRDFTAFLTDRGKYRFRRSPMGLSGSPFSFQLLVDRVLRGIQHDALCAYLDDLCLSTNTFEKHISLLTEIFKRFRSANLTLKASKCIIGAASVPFLGHILTPEGIKPNPEKTEAIRKIPVPPNTKKLRQFLGVTGFYRKYIPGYSLIAAPLYALTKKDASFVWSTQCQTAFEKLKDALISKPILQFINWNKHFYLCTDASKQGIGCALCQEDNNGELKPVAFAGRSFNQAEQNYTVSEQELLSIVWAYKHFKIFLEGNEFTIMTDHAPLTYLKSKNHLSGRLARWSILLQDMKCEIKHLAGKLNVLPDYLSRMEFDQTSTDEDKEIEAFPDMYVSETTPNTSLSALNQLDANTNNENSGFAFEEKQGSLFDCPPHFSLGHCVGKDLAMGAGIAVAFKERFGHVQKLKSQSKQVGEVATLHHRGKYIYYLITKEKSWQLPTYNKLKDSLINMKNHCVAKNVQHLALPRIGCGLDQLEWDQVKQMIIETFCDMPIEVHIYTLPENQSYGKQHEKSNLNAITRAQSKAIENKLPANVTQGDDTRRNKFRTKALQNSTNIEDSNLTPAKVIQEQQADPECKQLMDFLKFGILPQKFHEAKQIAAKEADYFIHENILYRLLTTNLGKETNTRAQLVIPQNLKLFILQSNHDNLMSGHLGASKMISNMRPRYFWPGMTSDIHKYVASCPDCLIAKKPTHPNRPPLNPHHITQKPFETVSMDFLGPLVRTHGNNKYIVVVTDFYSRYSIIWATPSITAPLIAKQFYNNVITKHGCVKYLQTDNGSTFTSALFQNLCKMFKIHQKFSSAYHPQSQGATERTNRSILSILRTYVDAKQKNWDDLLCSVEFALNNSVMKTTGFSPFYMLYGRMPVMPDEIDMPDLNNAPGNVHDILKNILENQEQAHAISRENMVKTQNQMKTRHDAHSNENKIRVGSTVYLHRPILRVPKTKLKMATVYYGPYCVTRVLSPQVVKLKRLSDNKYFKKPVNVSRLKIATLRKPLNSWDPIQNDPLEDDTIDLSQPPQDNNRSNSHPPLASSNESVLDQSRTTGPCAVQAGPVPLLDIPTLPPEIPQAVKEIPYGNNALFHEVEDVKDAVKADKEDTRLLVYFKDKTRKWLPFINLNESARNIVYSKNIPIRKIPLLRSIYT